MVNKPNKFKIKFWLVFCVESKYIYNGFSSFGKDLTRSGDVNSPRVMVMRPMTSSFNQDFNAACNRNFTSFDLLLRLTKQECRLVGPTRLFQREIRNLLKEKRRSMTP